MYVFSFLTTETTFIKTLFSVSLHQRILGILRFSSFTSLINLQSGIKCHYFFHKYILFFSQDNNIPDPNIIIFEMTKDDRKDFYRTIGKQIE